MLTEKLISHQRNLFLQQIKTITENYNWSKCREQLPKYIYTNIYNTYAKNSGNTSEQRQKDYIVKGPRNMCENMSPGNDLEASPMIP